MEISMAMAYITMCQRNLYMKVNLKTTNIMEKVERHGIRALTSILENLSRVRRLAKVNLNSMTAGTKVNSLTEICMAMENISSRNLAEFMKENSEIIPNWEKAL